jgi:hypothetical protein
VKKLTEGFDNGLGAILVGEHSLASFLSKKLPEGISGLFNTIDPDRKSADPLFDHLVGDGERARRNFEA